MVHYILRLTQGLFSSLKGCVLMNSSLHDVRKVAYGAGVCLVMLIGCESKRATPPPRQTPVVPVEVSKASEFYASRPYYERPREYSSTPTGLGDTDAETCGACHRAIYEEWKISTHHRAYFNDAQFMTELEKSRGAHDPNAGDVGWVCVNCHIPTYPQLEKLVVSLDDGLIHKPNYVDNPLFKPDQQADAIGCATCHVKDGVVHGPYGDTNAPHPTKRDPTLLDERICATCHQANAQYPVQNLGCFFSTVEEWRDSPSAAKSQPCQHCHMPVVERKIAEAFDVPVRKTRRHWFGGSLIPKKPEFAAELEPLKQVYGSGLSFEAKVAHTSHAFAPNEEPPNMPPEKVPELLACIADCTVIDIGILNDRAGHHMPSGDPERHIEVLVEAVDADGKVVGRAYDMIGSRYQWWPKIKLLRDTRIPAGSARTLSLSIPDAVTSSVTITLTAHKYRMYEEAFTHHELEGRYVRGRRFHASTWVVNEGGALERTSLIDDLNPE